jgi:hypothetical protein
MCLYVSKKHPNKITAKKDFYTMKIATSPLKINENTKTFRSLYQNSSQTLGKIITSEIDSPFGGVINRGLHTLLLSYKGWRSSILPYNINSNRVILLAKIPKGTKYYIGIDGDIASDQLILVELLASGSDLLHGKSGFEIIPTYHYYMDELQATFQGPVMKYVESKGYNLIPS